MSALEPPTKILKPRRQGSENITQKWLQEKAFNDPYYIDKTGNWSMINMNSILDIIQTCAWDALQKHSNVNYAKRFSDQPESVIDQIYNTFEGELGGRGADPAYHEVVEAMLKSTQNLGGDKRDRRWLFMWALEETIRSKKKSKNPRQYKWNTEQEAEKPRPKKSREVHLEDDDEQCLGEVEKSHSESEFEDDILGFKAEKRKPLRIRIQDLINYDGEIEEMG